MRCGIALGSNIGNRLAHLRAAKAALAALHEGVGAPLVSGVYESEPVDCAPDAPTYLNAVIEIETELKPEALLRKLQRIERAQGRPLRHGHNTPRTLDLDLLYAGDTVLDTQRLTLPHPRMTGRRFVMQPLVDLRPGLILPGFEKSVTWLLCGLPETPSVYPFDPFTL